MVTVPRSISLEEWDTRYVELRKAGLCEPDYGGPLSRHVKLSGDLRLHQLRFDNSAAALRLWNFLLTENDRLQAARERSELLVGTMKDLGTVPVMAYSLPCVRAFYPDGTWWTPCLMQCSDKLLEQAEALGVEALFCPVRATLAAFENRAHFPIPDLLVCSVGATCDDFSAIAQRLEHLGHRIVWWEIPRRRPPEPNEPACTLPGGLQAPKQLVEIVCAELERVADALGDLAGCKLDGELLREGIRAANAVRRQLAALRSTVYNARGAPLPALEMLIVEMLAIHYCSDRAECMAVLRELLAEAQRRVAAGMSYTRPDAVRVFWVNPPADLRIMNVLEECGAQLSGTDFMFTHALELIPEDLPPFEALARTALADPMIGTAAERAHRIAVECRKTNAQAVVIARIPGASHCPWESEMIRSVVQTETQLPIVEIEVPHVCDALLPNLRNRLQTVIEIAQERSNTK